MINSSSKYESFNPKSEDGSSETSFAAKPFKPAQDLHAKPRRRKGDITSGTTAGKHHRLEVALDTHLIPVESSDKMQVLSSISAKIPETILNKEQKNQLKSIMVGMPNLEIDESSKTFTSRRSESMQVGQFVVDKEFSFQMVSGTPLTLTDVRGLKYGGYNVSHLRLQFHEGKPVVRASTTYGLIYATETAPLERLLKGSV